MNNSPTYHGNLAGNFQSKMLTSHWTVATQAWDEGRYLDSFYAVLDYINPALRKEYGNALQNKFSIPHGSVSVDITLHDHLVEIYTPFVDITGAIRVPLLRKVAELNFYPLELASILMKENQLYFTYNTTLDTCEPLKIYYVLKEICRTADRYDDDFREKFKTKNLVEPKVEFYPPQDISKAWDALTKIAAETLAYANYFDGKRWYGFTVDTLIIGLKRITFSAQPQGYLKNEIDRVLAEMVNENLTVADRIQYGRALLNNIVQGGIHSFAKNLYEVETFVPDKWSTSLETIQKNTADSLARVKQAQVDQNYIGACIQSLYFIYDLFYYNYVPGNVETIFNDALANAAGKDWKDAAGIITSSMQDIVNVKISQN
jgi:hypothetical protein